MDFYVLTENPVSLTLWSSNVPWTCRSVQSCRERQLKPLRCSCTAQAPPQPALAGLSEKNRKTVLLRRRCRFTAVIQGLKVNWSWSSHGNWFGRCRRAKSSVTPTRRSCFIQWNNSWKWEEFRVFFTETLPTVAKQASLAIANVSTLAQLVQ